MNVAPRKATLAGRHLSTRIASLDFSLCRNCQRAAFLHSTGARCGDCYLFLIDHGYERPRDLYDPVRPPAIIQPPPPPPAIIQPPPPPPAANRLTDAQRRVWFLASHGYSYHTISRALGINETSVRGHMYEVLDKLCLANRVQAMLHAVHTGLVRLEDVELSYQPDTEQIQRVLATYRERCEIPSSASD